MTPIRKLHLLAFCILFSSIALAQQLNIEHVSDLKISHPINHIYKLISNNNSAILVADARFDKGDLDGFLIQFDLEGKVLKELRIGKAITFERIVNVCKNAEGYYLLMNSVEQNGKASLILYNLDNSLNIVSEEVIVIPEMQSANTMIFNPEKYLLEIVVSISDHQNNTFPRLVQYNLADKTMSHLDFKLKNRPGKIGEADADTPVIETNGNKVNQKMTPDQLRERGLSMLMFKVNKECVNIQFANNSYKELLLSGWENSKTITDFWIAKVVDNAIVWEDMFTTKIGGDEGKFTFKTDYGYLVVGHEYTKNDGSFYSYRTLALDNNGTKLSEQKFDTGNKDWFKDLIQIDEKHFLLFGQSQEITRSDSIEAFEEVLSSNLWTILVDSRGEYVADYLHKTKTLDESCAIAAFENNTIIVVSKTNEVINIGKIILNF